MPAFDVIKYTPAAKARLGEIIASNRSKNARGIRIGVKKGGCAGMEYTIDLVSEPNPLDDSVDAGNGTFWIDPAAVLFLLGTTIDYQVTKLKTGFVFLNPNQTSACGCGESVELAAAEMTPELLRAKNAPSSQ